MCDLISTLESSNSGGTTPSVDASYCFPLRRYLDNVSGLVWSGGSVSGDNAVYGVEAASQTELVWPLAPCQLNTIRRPLPFPIHSLDEAFFSSMFRQSQTTLAGLESLGELKLIHDAQKRANTSASSKPSRARCLINGKQKSLSAKFGGPRHANILTNEPPRKKSRTHGSNANFRAPRAYPMGTFRTMIVLWN